MPSRDGRVAYLDVDGTLTGYGGSIFRGNDETYCTASVEALGMLHAAGVPLVLVSGRAVQRLATVARLVGADGALAELGAPDCDYPTAPGQTVFDAIAATGIVDELRARYPTLYLHPQAGWGREASHLLMGPVNPAAVAWVSEASGGALRLADNGRIDNDGTHVFHLLPTAASKAAAVARDIARRGADPARCLAVGDSAEDAAIAEVVGHFALTRNGADADPALAARVEWITDQPFGAGVREAVTRWLDSCP